MAAARGEVPVGAAVLAADGTLLARGGNRVEAEHDASAHAELLVMREAAPRRLGSSAACSAAPWRSRWSRARCARPPRVHFRIARVGVRRL